MLQLRRLVPALARSSGSLRAELSTSSALLQAQPKDSKDKKEDVEGYELLPPGCSMVDPTYNLSEGGVNFADPAPSPSARSAKPARKTVPQTPTSLAAAQQSLKDSQPKKAEEEEEPYVYLPPGSSMREPGYNSMSDPVGGRVYYRDPVPVMRKK